MDYKISTRVMKGMYEELQNKMRAVVLLMRQRGNDKIRWTG